MNKREVDVVVVSKNQRYRVLMKCLSGSQLQFRNERERERKKERVKWTLK